MFHFKLSFFVGSLAIAFCSCKDNEDITDTVNKAGSVETSVHISHIDQEHDLLTTEHKVWVKHDLYKTVQYNDTIPSLGIESTAAENEEGDKKNVAIPKDYEIFITVK